MNGLDISALQEDPRFWIAVSFVVFVGVFVKLAAPKIMAMLDARSQNIHQQLEQANRLREQAEAMLEASKRQHEQAAQEAAALVAQAAKDAAALRTNAENELNQTIARRTEQAEALIARTEREAIEQLRTGIVDKALDITKAVVAAHLQSTEQDPAIARALQAVERHMH